MFTSQFNVPEIARLAFFGDFVMRKKRLSIIRLRGRECLPIIRRANSPSAIESTAQREHTTSTKRLRF